MTGEPTSPAIRLLLLRHGQVPHHRADVAPTDLGMAQAEAAGHWFAEQAIDVAALLSGETRRTIDTAQGFAAGRRAGGAAVPDPEVSFALRNPDLYLGGHRVNLGEGATFLAGQVPAMTEADVEASPFFAGFMGAPDRIGYWLEHPNPPGEDAKSVGRRIDAFARSLADVPALAGRTVVAITHSPVLRAVRHHHWADYPREPPFLHGYALTLGPEGGLTLDGFATETGDLPPTSRPGAGLITDTTKQEPV